MSELTVYTENDPETRVVQTQNLGQIQSILGELCIVLERWNADHELPDDADNAAILAAYSSEIDRLIRERGYRSVDVISMRSDHPDREVLRQKFLSEHTHSEDEVRFFVRGEGLFVVHAAGKVFAVRCTRGDLISVPAHTRHWFDMGPEPDFTAIRLFNDPEGWVANFTGDTISDHFPRLKNRSRKA